MNPPNNGQGLSPEEADTLRARVAELETGIAKIGETRDRLRTILDGVGEAISVQDPDYRIVWQNELDRFYCGELKGRYCYEAYENRGEPCAHCVAPQVMADGQRRSYESQSHRKDGTIADVSVMTSALRDTEGKIVGFVETARNITERKRTERSLRESEERLQLALRGADLGVWDWDIASGKVVTNDRLADMLGLRPEDLVRPAQRGNRIHPDDVARMRAAFNAHLEGKVPFYECEYRLRAESGKWKWVLDRGQVVERDAQGAPVRAAGTHLDITERKEAEAALRASEGRYRTLFDGVPVGLYRTTPDGKIEDANHAMADMLGFPNRQALLETNAMDLYADPQMREAWKAGFEGKESIRSFECQFRRADGRLIWVQSLARCIRDENWNVVYYEGALEDITEQKEAAEAVRRSEEAYRLLFEESLDGVIVAANGRIVQANRAFGEIHGEPVENLIGRSPLDLLAPEERERATERIRRIAGSEVLSASVVYKGIKANGEDVWVEVRSIPTEWEGEPALHSIVHDITARKKMEDELFDKTVRLQTVLDTIQESINVIDLDGTVLWVNRQTEKNHADSVGKKCWEVFEERDERCSHCPHPSVSKDGKPREYETTISLRGSNEPAHYLVRATPLRDADGEIRSILEVVIDITQLRRAEKARRDLEAQVQHAQKLESLGVLAGGIAHDFNNLLVGVLGNAGMALMELPETSPACEYLTQIEKAARRAADLTKQMLAYSGKGRFIVEPVCLSRIVEEMAHLLKVSIPKKTVLKLNLDSNLPSIEADASQMSQVVMNLITNAAEAIDDRTGVISVSTRLVRCDREYLRSSYFDDDLPEGDYVCFEVADSGCGMDKEHLSKIFDPFFTTKFTGRGLGLAAVLGIVRGHRGMLKIDSAPGAGTTFRVLFRASKEPVKSHDPTPSSTEAWYGSGVVLVADDEESVLTVARKILESVGFEVRTARDGREAVEEFRRGADEIEVVLLDMTMPNMSGDEAFREIRKIRPDARIVLSSGYNEYDVTQRLGDEDLSGFIQKPYRPQVLLRIMRDLLTVASE